LELLIEAIKYTDRAYIFDNSLDQQFLLAEITNAKDIELKSTEVPAWFEKYILDKI
jgi:predicted ABC-type ATPase